MDLALITPRVATLALYNFKGGNILQQITEHLILGAGFYYNSYVAIPAFLSVKIYELYYSFR